jgi:hypothetical protein
METIMHEIDRLIPVAEAFELAGMRRTKGYAEVTAGRLAIVRNGRRTFIRASEVQRYIDSLDQASSPAQGR